VDKLVGVLGSITQRKVSEIFTVQKIKQCDLKPNDRRADLPDIYFKVKQVKARGKDVEDWLFRYDSNIGGWGQPVELTDNGVRVVNTKELEAIKEADERFKSFAWTSSGATYTDLEKHLKAKGVTSNRKIATLFNVAMENNIIYKTDKKKYHYNGLKELPQDSAEQLPFDRQSDDEPDF
jgi:hypothetical protein